jgi:DNA mismatch endonuclease (patch repair protein)
MKAMPRRNTGAEISVRRALFDLGLRYRVHLGGLPGSPDIVFTKVRIAVFVDGCFWHLCPEHGTLPKNNAKWWAAKLEENVARDCRKDLQLEQLGWMPVHVWEHEDPICAAEKIRRIWWERGGRSAGQTKKTEDP